MTGGPRSPPALSAGQAPRRLSIAVPLATRLGFGFGAASARHAGSGVLVCIRIPSLPNCHLLPEATPVAQAR
jgi:hypothetical protein